MLITTLRLKSVIGYLLGPIGRYVLLGGLLLFFVYSLYSDFKTTAIELGKKQEQLEQAARSDETKKSADEWNAIIDKAVLATQQATQRRIRQIDDAFIHALTNLPDLTKDNPKCVVPIKVINNLNAIK